MKHCGACGLDKPITEFNINKTKRDGLQTKCRPCMKLYYKQYYANVPKERERLAFNRDRDRNKTRDFVRALKENSACTDCNKKYPYYVMQFDHIGTNKKFNISTAVAGNTGHKTILEEISKCEIVCANCHMERTHSRLIPVV